MCRFLLALVLVLTVPLAPRAETGLKRDLEALTANMPATVGIAVIIDGRHTVTVNNDQHFPLMSVFKFHQAVAVAQRLAERGIPLETEIWITKEDLPPNTWSPLRDAHPEGNFRMSIAELLRLTLQQSDNNACDILFDRICSVKDTETYIHQLGISDCAISATEADMHTDLDKCRDNWTTPLAAARLMERFLTEDILPGAHHEFIKATMIGCTTGANRLARPLAGSGAVLGHKTGTSDRTRTDGLSPSMTRALSCCRTGGITQLPCSSGIRAPVTPIPRPCWPKYPRAHIVTLPEPALLCPEGILGPDKLQHAMSQENGCQEAPAIPGNCFFGGRDYIVVSKVPQRSAAPAGTRRAVDPTPSREQATAMSKLFLVHDFSPDSSALFAAFARHAPLLAENSIELAPLNSLNCESVLTHDFLWFNRGETRALPPHISAMWDAIAEKLASGKNVLMFTRIIEPASQEYFWRHLPERVDLERHAPELLFIFGRPSLLLEQYHQTEPAFQELPLVQTHGEKWLGSIAPVLSLIRERAGSARCKYLFNTTENPAGAPRPELFGEVFDFLGCPLPDLSQPDPSGTGFKSHQTRRLFRALEVRGNAWPALDAHACRAALLELDRDLPAEWVTPLAARREFARTEAEALSALEALSGASPGSLAPPPAFVEEPEADLAAPLSPTLIKAFVARISPAERESLRARLLNDRPLLNADHAALLAGLSADGEFSHMGGTVPPPELTVLTMTFNHEKFIAQCMDSVLQQKTDFPVQHLVLDHSSTDGTAAIVAAYARKHPSIRPVLLSQHVPYENVTGIFLRCRSKYAALCDGDDYFTEPTKLQKQVEMLEANPGLAVSFHPVAAVFEDGSPPAIFPPLSNMPKRSKKEFYLADLMKGNFIQTNSVVYRWRFREGLPAWFRPDLCPGDFYWHMLHAETGKIGFIPEIMSVYRRHSNALYAKAFTSSRELRRDYGMAELEAYNAYNEHFGNRYFRDLSRLANGVFANFLQISLMENDHELFNAAVEKYPEFAKSFLKDQNQQYADARGAPGKSTERAAPKGQ